MLKLGFHSLRHHLSMLCSHIASSFFETDLGDAEKDFQFHQINAGLGLSRPESNQGVELLPTT